MALATTDLAHTDRLPPAVVPALRLHLNILREVLAENLVGLYVHGSVAMGCFHPNHSDLDYLVLVASPLTAQARTALASAFLAHFGQAAPAAGIEMSIVQAHFAGAGYRHPTPYEFHMGTQAQVRQHGLPHDHEYLDPDLAAHFTVTKRRGLCLYGKPIDQVFADVPRADYLDSIGLDAAESLDQILQATAGGPTPVPVYAVLNFCRVLAVIQADLVTSKSEGGDWGLAHLPACYHPIIAAALHAYRTGLPAQVDGDLLKQYATFAWSRIEPHFKPRA